MRKILKKSYTYLLNVFTKEGREILRLKNAKRHAGGRTFLFESEFEFVDPVSFAWQYLEIFKRQLYNFNTENTRPYIIDCGANIGVSILYFKKRYPSAMVVGFEPDKNVFTVLQNNIQNAKLKDVVLINKALWDKEEKINFIQEGADGGSITEYHSANNDLKVCEIEATSLRNFLNKMVDFLKIDIEGSEAVVLKNCSDLLYHVKCIFIEYHSTLNKSQELDSILKILTDNGFRYNIESATLFNEMPFIGRKTINNYDNLLNIYAFK